MRLIKLKDKTEILKIAIFVEDKYGPGFIRKVIDRLIEDGKIKNRRFEYQRNSPALIKKCNESKFRKVKSVVREVDKVLIIIDKENIYNYDEDKDIWRHLSGLKSEDKSKIVVIATGPEIEEWICISYGIAFDKTGYNVKDKPNEVLKRKLSYKNERLKDFADKLDFDKLLTKSESFKLFYKSLTT